MYYPMKPSQSENVLMGKTVVHRSSNALEVLGYNTSLFTPWIQASMQKAKDCILHFTQQLQNVHYLLLLKSHSKAMFR